MSRRRRTDFDRIAPPRRRVRERSPGERASRPDDPRGRAALFSATDGGPGPGGWAVAAVHCRRCGASSVMDLPTLVGSMWPVFLFVPWLPYPLFAACPACGRRSWLRPRWPPVGVGGD